MHHFGQGQQHRAMLQTGVRGSFPRHTSPPRQATHLLRAGGRPTEVSKQVNDATGDEAGVCGAGKRMKRNIEPLPAASTWCPSAATRHT